ncbi:MAG: thioredoxin family protein [Bacteroidales bacterium]|nr:thioredoxin family protein [Bacteroidales bacterium]
MRIKILLLFLLVSMQLSAQIHDPVQWSITENKKDDNTLEISYKATIEEGWNIYSNILPQGGPVATSVTYTTLENAEVDGDFVAERSAVEEYLEAFSMNVGKYKEDIVFKQRIKILSANYVIEGNLRYMACNDADGICAPPASVAFEFKSSQTKKELLPYAYKQLSTEPSYLPQWTPMVDELQSFSDEPEEGNSLLYIFIASFIGGLLALLTPCVWPMIPMTVSFFLKHTETRKKAIAKAVTYGLSIIIIYLVLGLLVTTLFGASALNDMSTNAWFNIFFFILLLFFAASFFGAFNLTLPASWTTKIDAKADATTGFVSILLMAFTLALVSFSCTGPIIGTLLVEAASSGVSVGPTIGMFGFSLALAIPFALFAIFPTLIKSLPKSGSWLNTIKVVLAFIELALALKFLSVADLAYGWGILPRETFLVLWIVIFFLLGLYLLGVIQFKYDTKPAHLSVTRLFLAIIPLAFSLYMLPGLWGAPLKAISAFAPPMSTQTFNLSQQNKEIVFDDYDKAKAYAKEQNKPLFVDFTGYGCVNCRKMESSVFVEDKVRDILDSEYVMVTLYVDDKTYLPSPMVVEENGREVTLKTYGDKWSYLQRYKFGANAQPYYILLSPEGRPLASPYGYDEDVEKFVEFLNKGIDK